MYILDVLSSPGFTLDLYILNRGVWGSVWLISCMADKLQGKTRLGINQVTWLFEYFCRGWKRNLKCKKSST